MSLLEKVAAAREKYPECREAIDYLTRIILEEGLTKYGDFSKFAGDRNNIAELIEKMRRTDTPPIVRQQMHLLIKHYKPQSIVDPRVHRLLETLDNNLKKIEKSGENI